jgi:hypothetical protein
MGQFVSQVRVRGYDVHRQAVDWTAQSGDWESRALTLSGDNSPQFEPNGTYQILIPGQNEASYMFLGEDGQYRNFELYGG